MAEGVERFPVRTAAIGVAVREASGIPLGLGAPLSVERHAQEGLPGRGPEPLDAFVLRECFHQ